MIPKIIHYFWQSDGPMPRNLQRCIDSWHKFCPDFKIICWDVASLGDNVPLWVKQAIENRKFAFAADYVRYYALYNYGGIYMDTDVELVKPFGQLLEAPYLMCKETQYSDKIEYVESGFLAMEKGHRFTRMMLDYYDGRPFVKPDGTLDTLALPEIFRNIVTANGFRFVDIESPDEIKHSDSELYVLPSEYFSPISLQTMELKQTDKTVAIHHFASSWQPVSFRLKKDIQRLIGPKLTRAIIRLKDVIYRRKQ